MNKHHWDDATLSAYIDGELDAGTQNALLEAMAHDKSLSEEVCRLRRTRDWMRSGFGSAEPPQRALPKARAHWPRLRSGLAASLMALAIGVGGGLLGYVCAEREHPAGMAQATDPNRIVLHIGDSDPKHFGVLLDYTEKFLNEHRNDGVKVEVVANAGGLDLLRVHGSAYEARVRAINEKYDNVQFIACMNAIRNLEKAGIDADLIQDVHTGETAVDHIVKRLREGWTYRKVDSLSDI